MHAAGMSEEEQLDLAMQESAKSHEVETATRERKSKDEAWKDIAATYAHECQVMDRRTGKKKKEFFGNEEPIISYMAGLELCKDNLASLGCAEPLVALWMEFLTKRKGPLRKDDWQMTVLFLKQVEEDEYELDKDGIMELFEDDPYSWCDIHEKFSEYLESGEIEEHEWVWEAKNDPASPDFEGGGLKRMLSQRTVLAVKEFARRGEYLGMEAGLFQSMGSVKIQFPNASPEDSETMRVLKKLMEEVSALKKKDKKEGQNFEKEHVRPLQSVLGKKYKKITVHYSPRQGIYAGGTYRLTFDLEKSPMYPITPPVCHCDTKVWHPNIADPDSVEKNVCHNYLHQGAAHGEGAGYQPSLQMAGVIQGVLLLFHEPSEGLGCLNPFDPLDTAAAEMYMNDREAFIAKVEEYKRAYAEELPIPEHELARINSATLKRVNSVGEAGAAAAHGHSEGAALAGPGEHRPGHPVEGTECLVTMEDIDHDNYCEYQCSPSMTWRPSKYSSDAVQDMLKRSFGDYVSLWEKIVSGEEDCGASIRSLVEIGPPIYLRDGTGLPLPPGDTHVEQFWFMNGGDDAYVSARLEGALEGAARQTMWDSHKEIYEKMSAVSD